MGFSFQIEKTLGEFKLSLKAESQGNRLGILGASGCGKSLTLKLLAGIETPDAGHIRIGENLLFDSGQKRNVKPQNRRIGYLFQNYALFPHMTVEDNICYVPGLERRLTQEEKKILAEKMLELVQLPGEVGKRFPRQLSGGQKQRVGIARALAAAPDILLMDEPFGAVDEITRRGLQEELLALQRKTGITIVFITHDIGEAFHLGSRVLIMKEGEIWQEGKPEELQKAPRDEFVRSLIRR